MNNCEDEPSELLNERKMQYFVGKGGVYDHG